MNEPLKLTRKTQENRDYWDTKALFDELHQWVPKRSFQPGEYTTGQAAPILGVTPSTIAAWCDKGLIPGAWRDEVHKWWHIPEDAFEKITARVQRMDSKWTRRYWVRQAAKLGRYE